MKINVRNIDAEIELLQADSLTLEIRYKQLFRQIIEDINQSFEAKRDFGLVNVDGNFNLDKIIMVNDVFSFDFGSRKIINRIYELLEKSANYESEDLVNSIKKQLSELAVLLKTESELDFEYDLDLKITDLLKMLNFKPILTKTFDPLKRIYGIIDLVNEIFPEQIICFVNLKYFLTQQEFNKLLEYCSYKYQTVLFLESNKSYKNPEEKIIVVDEDLYCY